MPLTDFYKSATKNFDVVIYENNILQDISEDSCSVSFKTTLEATTVALEVNADVTTSGSAGKAIFEISSSQTNITEGSYYYELKWLPSGSGETHILEQAQVNVLHRVNE